MALCFPVRVLVDPAPALADGPLADSLLGDRVETGTTGICMPPSNPGEGEIKLSKTCIQLQQE
jgi:hypothetical protein